MPAVTGSGRHKRTHAPSGSTTGPHRRRAVAPAPHVATAHQVHHAVKTAVSVSPSGHVNVPSGASAAGRHAAIRASGSPYVAATSGVSGPSRSDVRAARRAARQARQETQAERQRQHAITGLSKIRKKIAKGQTKLQDFNQKQQKSLTKAIEQPARHLFKEAKGVSGLMGKPPKVRLGGTKAGGLTHAGGGVSIPVVQAAKLVKAIPQNRKIGKEDAQQTLLHEYGHVGQRRAVGRKKYNKAYAKHPMRYEAGADRFAKIASRKLHLDKTNPVAGYPKLTKREGRISAKEALRGQFTEPKQKPPVKKTKKVFAKPISGLSPAQTKVAQTVLAQGIKAGATGKELLSSMETGLQESNLANLAGGSGTSEGWRQETAQPQYPNPRNVRASARRYFSETAAAGRGRGETAGELSQAVQRSAFPGAYDPHKPQAQAIVHHFLHRVKKTGGKVPKGSGGGKKLHTNELFYDPGINLKDGKPTSPVGGHTDHVHFASTDPKSILRAAKVARKLGATVTENPAFGGVAPVHVTGSYHYRTETLHGHKKLERKAGGHGKKIGEAIDISGSPAVLAKVNKALARMSGAPTSTTAGTVTGATATSATTTTPSTPTATVKATAPSSPGGTKITATERRGLRKTGEDRQAVARRRRKRASQSIGRYRKTVGKAFVVPTPAKAKKHTTASPKRKVRLGL